MDKNKMFSVAFFGAFIGGILYTNTIGIHYIGMTSIFNGYYLEQFTQVNILATDYIVQVLGIRMFPLIIILGLAYTKVNKIGTILFVSWIGFLWGIYLSLGVVSQGIKGVILCVLGVMPQIIFYIPAYIIGILFAYSYPSSRWNLWKTIVIGLCILCGIVVECNINPTILKWYIKLM